jgi:acyl-CoA synthetase
MDEASNREQHYTATGLWTQDRIGDLIPRRAHRFPDRELFLFEGRRISYGMFAAWVELVAANMVAEGVTRGDRVMVQLPNCLEALVLQAAAFRIGAINVPVIPIYREHETRQIFVDVRPAVVAVAHALGDRTPHAEVDAILGELGLVPKVKYIVGGVPPGWSTVAPCTGDVLTSPVSVPEPASADEPALLLYTSGTTSAPKGAYLTSRALIAHLHNMATVADLDDRSVIAAGTPLSHLGGFIAGLILPAYLGARSVILPRWHPDSAVDLIEREQVSVMMGATVFLHDLVERYAAGGRTGHRLTKYMCAGAAIPPQLIRDADAVGIFATRNYGMTETAGICTGATSVDPLDKRAQWDGRVLPGMEIEAVDHHRRPLPGGSQGELRIRGAQLFSGYTDAAATANQLDDDGWFYPGDIGVVVDGWVRMTGRSKDIVNRGGEKFSAQDIEQALVSHPDIASAAVTAIPDDRFGEAVGAWITLAVNARWDGPDRYLRHLDQLGLARAKFPVEWHVLEAIPTSPTGKIQKFRLPEAVDLITVRDARLAPRQIQSTLPKGQP